MDLIYYYFPALETIRDFIDASMDNDGTLPIGYDANLRQHSNHLKRSIHTAHDHVLKAIREDGSLLGMGTTVVGAMHKEEIVAIAHVGDSRGYRLRNGHLELLTQDHTWVNEQVVAGYLSEEQAKSHPLKNVVTRALGGDSDTIGCITGAVAQAHYGKLPENILTQTCARLPEEFLQIIERFNRRYQIG